MAGLETNLEKKSAALQNARAVGANPNDPGSPRKHNNGTMTIVVLEFVMRKMTAGFFKKNCLAVIDEVQAQREAVVITKRGKPVAKLVPVNAVADDIFGFLEGKVTIVEDVVSPALSLVEWGELA